MAEANVGLGIIDCEFLALCQKVVFGPQAKSMVLLMEALPQKSYRGLKPFKKNMSSFEYYIFFLCD